MKKKKRMKASRSIFTACHWGVGGSESLSKLKAATSFTKGKKVGVTDHSRS